MYKKLLTGFGAWSTSQTEVLCHFRSDILLFYFSQVIDGRFIDGWCLLHSWSGVQNTAEARSGLLISMWEKLYLTRVIDKKNGWFWYWRKVVLQDSETSFLFCIAKTVSKKIKALTLLYNFLLQRLLFISTNLPYALSWNTVDMSGVMFLISTFYLRLILHLLTLLNPWFIVEMETVKVFSVGIRMVIDSLKN